MTRKFVPKPMRSFPDFWDESFENWLPDMHISSKNGLSISEDENNIYVEAALPGMNIKNIEITLEKGILWIKGERVEEHKERKYYRKAEQSYSYHISVPGNIDESKEPTATYKDGIMTITFSKTEKEKPKRIQIQANH